eukprot:4559219-Amphidinium_carterae.1
MLRVLLHVAGAKGALSAQTRYRRDYWVLWPDRARPWVTRKARTMAKWKPRQMPERAFASKQH